MFGAIAVLAAGGPPRQVAHRAQEALGVGASQANRYVGVALARLTTDALKEPIECKRARLVSMLHGQIRRALDLKRQFQQNGKLVEYDAPDLRAANEAIRLLAIIEGVVKP
jgi:hypothetical protein